MIASCNYSLFNQLSTTFENVTTEIESFIIHHAVNNRNENERGNMFIVSYDFD